MQIKEHMMTLDGMRTTSSVVMSTASCHMLIRPKTTTVRMLLNYHTL